MRNKRLIIIFSIISIIALLAVVNSVIFSVQNVTAFCANDFDTDTEQKVVDTANIKKGQSIFFLDEQSIKAELEAQIPTIRVLGIEQIFPNKVSINFVNLYEYLAFTVGSNYVFCDNTGRILRISNEIDTNSVIMTSTVGTLTNTEVGQNISTSVAGEAQLIVSLLDCLDRLNYTDRNRIDLISSIDLTQTERVVLHTRAGVVIEIMGTSSLLQKLQKAVSFYLQSEANRTRGRILVYQTSGEIFVAYDDQWT